MADILTTDDYAALPIITGDLRIAYGDHADQFGELFLPHGAGPHPTAILIHGGCWRDRFGLEQLGQMARRLSDGGIAVWNLEYRRIGAGGGWPETFADIAAGADHLRVLADEYWLDLSRVVAVGHSAGGHLVCWLAGRRSLPADSPLWTADPLPLHGVLALAGLPDLPGAVAAELCSGAPQELMGGLPSEAPERYDQGSAHSLLPYGIPHRHIVGRDDVVVPVDYLQRFVNLAVAKGDNADLITLSQTGHFEIVVADSPAWPTVEATIQRIFNR